jgi:hypothetical protein
LHGIHPSNTLGIFHAESGLTGLPELFKVIRIVIGDLLLGGCGYGYVR